MELFMFWTVYSYTNHVAVDVSCSYALFSMKMCELLVEL
jgi:hypothetical protein